MVELITQKLKQVSGSLTTPFCSQGDWHAPGRIFEKEPEPASERTIDLFQLTKLLERQKREKAGRRTIFLWLNVPKARRHDVPGGRQYRYAINSLAKTRLKSATDYYDLIGVTQRKEGYPSLFLYPTPPFLESLFGLDHSGVAVSELIAFFLSGGYADRVVILPRVRYFGGWVVTEFAALELYMRNRFGKDLPIIPTTVYRKYGVPVFTKRNFSRL